eukprot:755734-Hanusia_phi.AAC.1
MTGVGGSSSTTTTTTRRLLAAASRGRWPSGPVPWPADEEEACVAGSEEPRTAGCRKRAPAALGRRKQESEAASSAMSTSSVSCKLSRWKIASRLRAR